MHCEAAGYEMETDCDRAAGAFFSIETDHGNPMNYPLKPRVTPGTLEIRRFDTKALREYLERLVEATRR